MPHQSMYQNMFMLSPSPSYQVYPVGVLAAVGWEIPQIWILAGYGQSGRAGGMDVSTGLYLKSYQQQLGVWWLHDLLRGTWEASVTETHAHVWGHCSHRCPALSRGQSHCGQEE